MKKTPLKRKGRSRFPKRRCPEYRAWIATHPCATCGRESVCCHVETQGHGGWDIGNCWPGCPCCHAEQHMMGINSFQTWYGIDLVQIAAAYGEAWAQRS